MAILGLRSGKDSVSTEFVRFAMVKNLLGIPYPITRTTRMYFGPNEEP